MTSKKLEVLLKGLVLSKDWPVYLGHKERENILSSWK